MVTALVTDAPSAGEEILSVIPPDPVPVAFLLHAAETSIRASNATLSPSQRFRSLIIPSYLLFPSANPRPSLAYRGYYRLWPGSDCRILGFGAPVGATWDKVALPSAAAVLPQVDSVPEHGGVAQR